MRYAGTEGNIFSPLQINKLIELGEQYSMDKIAINPYCIHSIGCDLGFGSSNTAVVATEFLPEESKIRVIFSQEWEHGDPPYPIRNRIVWVDGSNRAFVNLLKVAFN